MSFVIVGISTRCCYNFTRGRREFVKWGSCEVDKILFSSSCAVYGNPETEKLSETHKVNPINPYGYSKLIGENIVQSAVKWYFESKKVDGF